MTTAADVTTIPPLDADALLAAAQERTGLSDFGDPTLPDRFRVLVARMREATTCTGSRCVHTTVASG